MGLPIRILTGSGLRLLIAWLLALQPMIGAYAAAASALAPMELCRGAPSPVQAPDRGAPSGAGDSAECCLACAPAPAPPPDAAAELFVPAAVFETAAARIETNVVPRAGLGPQAARAPPL